MGNIAAAVSAAVGETETGLAAVYSGRLNGHRTASGARYNPNALTAAHQTLPFGTKVKVTFPLSPPPLPIPTTGEGEGGGLSIVTGHGRPARLSEHREGGSLARRTLHDSLDHHCSDPRECRPGQWRREYVRGCARSRSPSRLGLGASAAEKVPK